MNAERVIRFAEQAALVPLIFLGLKDLNVQAQGGTCNTCGGPSAAYPEGSRTPQGWRCVSHPDGSMWWVNDRGEERRSCSPAAGGQSAALPAASAAGAITSVPTTEGVVSTGGSPLSLPVVPELGQVTSTTEDLLRKYWKEISVIIGLASLYLVVDSRRRNRRG